MINVEVTKGASENNLSVLRRFQKRVQGAGILNRVRGNRYTERTKSENVKKAKTLAFLKKREETAELIKLGKIQEVSKFSKRKR
jgi:ribosomal protein S21